MNPETFAQAVHAAAPGEVLVLPAAALFATFIAGYAIVRLVDQRDEARDEVRALTDEVRVLTESVIADANRELLRWSDPDTFILYDQDREVNLRERRNARAWVRAVEAQWERREAARASKDVTSEPCPPASGTSPPSFSSSPASSSPWSPPSESP